MRQWRFLATLARHDGLTSGARCGSSNRKPLATRGSRRGRVVVCGYHARSIGRRAVYQLGTTAGNKNAIVHLSVLDRDLVVPPVSPSNGQRYIPAVNATGAWAGKSLAVAAFQDGAWMFYAPQPGWLAWIADESRLAVYNGTAWALL